MKTELREAWEDSLLSGLYPQGESYLNDDGKYCCLGVLCEAAISLGMPVERVAASATYYRYSLKGSEVTDGVLLTDGLLELFDLSEDDSHDLADLNDTGHSFEDIVASFDERVSL